MDKRYISVIIIIIIIISCDIHRVTQSVFQSFPETMNDLPATMEDLRLSPLKENGTNIGRVGTIWPDRTVVEDVVMAEDGYFLNVTRIRELSCDQPEEVEAVLSLTYPAPLNLDREKVEHLLRYFMDILRSKKNMFRENRQPRVLAFTLLHILPYINQEKFLGLDESRWPITPFFMRAIRSMIKKTSKFKGCAFLRKSNAWRGVRWYLREMEMLVCENWKLSKIIREECEWAIKNVNIAKEEGYDI